MRNGVRMKRSVVLKVMTTPARLQLDKENVVGDPTMGGMRLKTGLTGETATKMLVPVSSSKSAFTPKKGLSDCTRKALENVINRKMSETESCEGDKPTFLVPQTPTANSEKLGNPSVRLFEKIVPQAFKVEKDYPEIENMPTNYEEDDYEDIWPKEHRLTSEELDRLASWRPVFMDGVNFATEPEPAQEFVEYMDDAFLPMPGFGDPLDSDMRDNTPMIYIPPPSPVSCS